MNYTDTDALKGEIIIPVSDRDKTAMVSLYGRDRVSLITVHSDGYREVVVNLFSPNDTKPPALQIRGDNVCVVFKTWSDYKVKPNFEYDYKAPNVLACMLLDGEYDWLLNNEKLPKRNTRYMELLETCNNILKKEIENLCKELDVLRAAYIECGEDMKAFALAYKDNPLFGVFTRANKPNSDTVSEVVAFIRKQVTTCQNAVDWINERHPGLF
jgi:hypothetical protein